MTFSSWPLSRCGTVHVCGEVQPRGVGEARGRNHAVLTLRRRCQVLRHGWRHTQTEHHHRPPEGTEGLLPSRSAAADARSVPEGGHLVLGVPQGPGAELVDVGAALQPGDQGRQVSAERQGESPGCHGLWEEWTGNVVRQIFRMFLLGSDLFNLGSWHRKLHIWSPNYTATLALHKHCKWLSFG